MQGYLASLMRSGPPSMLICNLPKCRLSKDEGTILLARANSAVRGVKHLTNLLAAQ